MRSRKSPENVSRMKAFVCTGFWRLPEQDDHLVAGTLHVSGNGDLRLCLIGTLGDKGGERSKPHRIVIGSVDDSPRGNSVTLTTGCATGEVARRLLPRGSGGVSCWSGIFWGTPEW